MATIVFPKRLDDRGAIDFSNDVLQSMDEPEISFDFSQLQFSKPFGVMLAAKALRFAHSKRQQTIELANRNCHLLNFYSNGKIRNRALSYLDYFNFLKHVGWSEVSERGTSEPGATYIPITEINKAELDSIGEDRLQKNIKKYSNSIARLLFKNEEETKIDMLEYFFTEMIRNVFEHSESNVCHVMAQRWRDETVEIAISDEGIGIQASLYQKYSIRDNVSAIRKSLEPAVSAVHFENTGSDDEWENSGFGLYVASQIGREMGGFSIFSNTDLLVFNNKECSMFRLPMNGTIIKVTLDVGDSDYFFNKLSRIVEKGETEASLVSGRELRASKASKLLLNR